MWYRVHSVLCRCWVAAVGVGVGSLLWAVYLIVTGVRPDSVDIAVWTDVIFFSNFIQSGLFALLLVWVVVHESKQRKLSS